MGVWRQKRDLIAGDVGDVAGEIEEACNADWARLESAIGVD